jgi:hypothetical protein
LDEGVRYPAIIQATAEEEFTNRNTGDPKFKPVLTLVTPQGRRWDKRWIPNKTAWKVLWKAWGNDRDDWLTHGIDLFSGYMMIGGEQIRTIFVALNPAIEHRRCRWKS